MVDYIPGADPVEITYDTWLIGFDENQNITNYEVFLNSAKTKEEGIEYASNLDKNTLILRKDIPKDVYTIALVVETVGTDKNDCVSFNMANVYEDLITIKEK